MAESDQKIKDQDTKISETETTLAEIKQTHEARVTDLDNQLKVSKEELE